MNNPYHTYRVVGIYKAVYVTYDDYDSAVEFTRNASKSVGLLTIEANDRRKK